MPRLERTLSSLPEIFDENSPDVSRRISEAEEGGRSVATDEDAEIGHPTLPAVPHDPVLLDLFGANLREALLSGSVDAELRLGRLIGEYLTTNRKGQ